MDFLFFLSQYRTDWGIFFFQGVTLLGQELLDIILICWLYWCSNKKLAYTLGMTYFTSGLLVQGLKITFRIPRPWILNPAFEPVASAVPAATGYSFPSGHTQAGTALFSTLAQKTPKPLLKILYSLTFLCIGFSRMYLGCHTPKDVLVSMGLTLCLSVLIYRLYYIGSLSSHQGPITIFLACVSILLAIYALILYNSQTIPQEFAADCIKASGAGLAFAAGYYIEHQWIRFSPPQNFRGKLSRILPGLLVALIIQQGLKYVIGTSLAADYLRYFLCVLWILVLYPLLFTKRSQNH